MDPKVRSRIDAGVGGVAFLVSFLRGKTVSEAQADARTAVTYTSPLVQEIAPHAERIWTERQARQATKKAPPCGFQGGIACVLSQGHQGEYHQDVHGVLFKVE